MVLPVDNLLKPRRKYIDAEYHQLIIEQQHGLCHPSIEEDKEIIEKEK